MGAFYNAHPMLFLMIGIFIVVILIGILLPLTVYLSARFIQWHMKKHPELVLNKNEADVHDAQFMDHPYVDNKGESGLKDN